MSVPEGLPARIIGLAWSGSPENRSYGASLAAMGSVQIGHAADFGETARQRVLGTLDKGIDR